MSRLVLLAVAAATMVSGLLLSNEVLAEHRWNGYHWPGTGTRTLHLENQAGAEYQVDDVVDDWNGLNAPVQLVVDGGSNVVVRSKNMNAWYLGLAEIRVDTSGHILEGRVTLNDRYLKEGNLYGYDWADRKAVLCQEVGHILGLDHVHDQTDTCMNDQLALTGENEQVSPSQLAGTTPNAHDGQELNAIYSHDDGGGDGGSGGNGGPPCSKNPDHPRCTGDGVWITIHVIPVPGR